jgi:hypothetical protein
MLTMHEVLLIIGYFTVALSVLAILIIAVDLVVYEFVQTRREAKIKRQALLRSRKAMEARRQNFFFDEPHLPRFVPGFNDTGEIFYRGFHVKGPQARAEYYAKLDALADTGVFANTEEL